MIPAASIMSLAGTVVVKHIEAKTKRPSICWWYFQMHFLEVWIPIKISLRFVPNVRINNIPALIQIMAWCRPGDKPLSEPMMVSLLTHICVTRPQGVNSLAPGWSGCNFQIFKLVIENSRLGTGCEIALRWMPQNPINGKSTLFQLMAWCHQATSHYLSQCWPICLLPFGITRPQRVNQQGLLLGEHCSQY